MPCPKLACPCHGLACHVKIVRAVSERVMINPCQCRSVSIRVHIDPCQSVSNPGVVIFAEKKRLRQDTYQQQDLSDPGVVIFTEKKAPAARYLSATGFVKSRGGHFHRKKSACDKIPISNRACQSPDHGCIMDFDNRKVTFRTDRTPLHRIAVQF